jgi:hypothetical protein
MSETEQKLWTQYAEIVNKIDDLNKERRHDVTPANTAELEKTIDSYDAILDKLYQYQVPEIRLTKMTIE